MLWIGINFQNIKYLQNRFKDERATAILKAGINGAEIVNFCVNRFWMPLS